MLLGSRLGYWGICEQWNGADVEPFPLEMLQREGLGWEEARHGRCEGNHPLE